ncbi:hypothetical protein HYN48_05430 [Flavobacterium magnum]|uniref:Fibronectin type-III domain-containing protein n=1 Tax=Flavobacterium magnum TaxID=2162713 RepID=A0A2S0RD58_9FLAO|nr:choice-of-anchor L domain-containing protein [Flavobacterium magnum]AWA29574.1 hypothetical protein HYN48_05430 [Flavobacterium magnum]
MKTQLHLSVCAFLIFIANAFSQTGNTCDNPIAIPSLPYQVSGYTGNYGDDFDLPQGTSCGALPATTNYLAGSEVFYSYTSVVDGDLTLSLTASSLNSGIFVYTNCASVGTACVAGLANSSSSTRSLTLNAIAGQTYIIVISSSGVTPEINYTLIVQQRMCGPRPFALSASEITGTQATLSWSNAFFPSYQIAVQPLGSSIPTGPGQYTSNTDSVTVSGLEPVTPYQFWVRSECAENSGIFTDWAGPFAFNTQMCDATNTCNYTFRLKTTASGWGSTRMQVRQNGIVLATLGSTFVTGQGPVDVTVPLCNGVPFDLFWSVANTTPGNKMIDILNSFGQKIFSKPAGVGSVNTILYSGVVDCSAPQCDLAPESVSVNGLTTNSANVAWVSPAITSWDIYLAAPGDPIPTVDTVPTYANVTTNSYTLSDLDDDTAYTVFIRSNCTPLSSGWSAASFNTLPICIKPLSLSVSSITTSNATLSWQKGTPADTAWEVLLLPSLSGQVPATPPAANPDLSGGGLLIPTTIYSPLTLDTGTLSVATIYLYYIRTVCSADLKSKWAGPYVFNTVTCDPADKCNYVFTMTDTGANGWNDGRMQIRQNGIVIKTIGNSINGASTSVAAALCNGVPFDLYWSEGGTAPSEIGVSIQNPYDDTIFTKLPGQGNPLDVLYSSIANCNPAACPKPSALTVNSDAMTQTSAMLAWTENGTATQWEVYVVPEGGPAPVNDNPVTGTGAYHIADSNPYLLTGLEPQTKYIYYVRAICSETEISTWPLTAPKAFTTKPLNDECSNATIVPVNPGIDGMLFAEGNTKGGTASLPYPSMVCGNFDDDIWFSFQATATTHLIMMDDFLLDSPVGQDLSHSLYSGDDCGSLTQLYCSTLNASVANNLTIGNYYKISVFTNWPDAQSGPFKIRITTPEPVTNDECNTAILVPTGDSTCSNATHGSIAGASASAQSTTCVGTPDDDIWFKFVAVDTNMAISIDNIAGYSDLVHSLYNGDCDNLTPLYCSRPHASIAENLIVGQTYYVRIWSYSDVPVNATFDLCIRKTTVPITVTTAQYTNEQLVSNVLINNPCVDISNVSSSSGNNFGSVNGIGYFTNFESNNFFPFTNGVVLSTGDAVHAGGHNLTTLSDGSTSWAGDFQLETAVNMDVGSRNASVLEFDFTTPTAYMSFNFLFASEEYGTYQCNFSDSFAFLLTDLVTGTTKNLAVLPDGSTPISVITIRDNAYNLQCSSVNPEFFDHLFSADLGNELFSAINFNGQTHVMTAASAIEPNHPYHIKLVIADRGDSQFDSAVFIQAGSFASGPPECHDKLRLTAFIDANNNGIKDDTEIPFTHGSFSSQLNNAGEVSHISTPVGVYTVYNPNPADTYDFSYTVDPEYQTYFTAGTTAFNDVNIPVGSGTTELFFPISILQPYTNASVSIVPVNSPRPGFDYVNKVVYTNLGMTACSGTITFNRAAPTSIVAVSQSGTTATDDGFDYSFSNLLPQETRTFDVTLHVPNIPAVHLGDLLTTSAVITAQAGDINSNDNLFTNTQVVVGSYDPNDKQEAHGGKVNINQFTADDYLYYTIRFQNTGTYNALNIRIEDLLDPQLDPASIRMVDASHNYVMQRVDNKLVWYFDYIQLPSVFQNEELSHGYVIFRVKPLPGFEAGDAIPNVAEIHFDTNPPIVTNIANTIFEIPLGIGQISESDVLLFPNPADQYVRIILANTSENIAAVSIFDMLGKSIFRQVTVNSREAELDISQLAKGVYMVEIVTENHLKQVKKLVIR